MLVSPRLCPDKFWITLKGTLILDDCIITKSYEALCVLSVVVVSSCLD